MRETHIRIDGEADAGQDVALVDDLLAGEPDGFTETKPCFDPAFIPLGAVMIEDALDGHPAVDLCAAVGAPDDYAGELPVAYVTLKAGATVSATELETYAATAVDEAPARPRWVTVLDAMPHENFVPSQAGIGFDVYIHDQSVFPHTDGHHFAIGPGQQVNVAIEQEKTVRLSRPYFEDDCMSAADVIRNEVRLEQADINNSYVIPYSQEYCEYECDFRFVFGGCGCDGGESGHCSSFRRTVECYNERYRDTLAPGNCHCQPTCEQTHYSLQISSGQYPSNLDVMVASRRNWTVQSEADMRSRLVYLDVYFKSLTVEVTRYVPALTLTDLFSTIGGLLGLFAGASVMTVIEFVDMGLVCLFTLVKKRLRKGSEVNDSHFATESVKNKR